MIHNELSVSLAQCTVYIHLPHAKQESFLLHRGRYKRGRAIEMKLGYETGHGGWGLERGDPSSVKSAEAFLCGLGILYITFSIRPGKVHLLFHITHLT